jgi:alcohol dehydrogenase class IV
MKMVFNIGRLPRIEFGRGVIDKLIPAIGSYGDSVLLVTGARTFAASRHWETLQLGLNEAGIRWWHCQVDHEPTVTFIDASVRQFAGNNFDVVVGLGGGSALDSAKAIAGLLRCEASVLDYLEGVGPELDYQGPTVPLIEVPTTAGTGSEVTRNAVLGHSGEQGFKKSFRAEQLVAELALIDPDLLLTCPRAIIAANGMDALTQLLESRVSLNSNRLMSILAEDGLRAVRDGLLPWFDQGNTAPDAAGMMAYAAFVSGVTLAHVGLGCVHGLAAPLGALYPIPHGVACGSLVADATALNIQTLQDRQPDSPTLSAYARCAEILMQQHFHHPSKALESLVSLLGNWRRHLAIPGLAQFGLDAGGIDRVVAQARGNSMKTNPVELTDEELRDLLRRCL